MRAMLMILLLSGMALGQADSRPTAQPPTAPQNSAEQSRMESVPKTDRILLSSPPVRGFR